MDDAELLDQGLAWTAARIATVPADRLDGPTPCGSWTLREVLDHIIDVLTLLTDAVDPPSPDAAAAVQGAGSTRWDRGIADLAARNRRAWRAPGVTGRTFDLPMGAMPAPVLLSSALLECVVHGWDISQASGERADIPEELAIPVLAFAQEALHDADRGDNFAGDLETGVTPSERLIAFLGRKPL